MLDELNEVFIKSVGIPLREAVHLDFFGGDVDNPQYKRPIE